MPNGMEKDKVNYKNIIGNPDDNVYHDMVNLYSDIFDDADEVFFKQRIKEHSKLVSILANG